MSAKLVPLITSLSKQRGSTLSRNRIQVDRKRVVAPVQALQESEWDWNSAVPGNFLLIFGIGAGFSGLLKRPSERQPVSTGFGPLNT